MEIILRHDIQLKLLVRMSSQVSKGGIVPLLPKILLSCHMCHPRKQRKIKRLIILIFEEWNLHCSHSTVLQDLVCFH